MGRRRWSGEDSENFALPVLCGGKAAVIEDNLLSPQVDGLAVVNRSVGSSLWHRCVKGGPHAELPERQECKYGIEEARNGSLMSSGRDRPGLC